MRSRAKVAISLDAELLARVERLRAKTGETRSALISRALSNLTADTAHSAKVRRYVQAYREIPERSEEIGAAREAARRALAHLEWDES